MVNNHQINATYDPNNPEMKQDFTRFCNYCKKSGHTIKYCWTLKKKNENEKNPLLNQKKHMRRTIQVDLSLRTLTLHYQTIGRTAKKVKVIVVMFQMAIEAEVTATLELNGSKQGLTR